MPATGGALEPIPVWRGVPSRTAEGRCVQRNGRCAAGCWQRLFGPIWWQCSL